MKKNLIFILLFLPIQATAASEALLDIQKLKAKAIQSVEQKYISTKKHQLELVDIRIFNNQDGKFASMSLVLTIAELETVSKGKYSPYEYDTYQVRFSLLTGELVKIIEGKFGHYEPIENQIIK